MTRAKKVILALICAAALCCAAIGGVLLARPAAEVRAEVDDLAIASVDGQIYDINTIDEIKDMITVTRVGADGQARPIGEDEYTLTIQDAEENTDIMDENLGIFLESYFGTEGNRTSAEFTLTVKDASDKTASKPVTVQWAPDTGYAKLSIVPAANASAIYPYTGLTSLASNRYITVYLLTAEEVRDGKTTSGFSPVGAVSFSGDLGAPDDAVLGTKYEVELEAEYTGSENVLFDTCRYTVLVTPAAPTSLLYNIDGSTVHKSANGAYTGIVAGDTIKDIVKSDLNFNVSYALGFRTIDGTDVHIKDYEYCDENGTVDADAEAFAWGENGYVYMKVTYEECGVTQTAVVGFQLTQSPVTPYDITAENAAAEEQPADRPYGEEQYALVYQYSRVEGEAGEGSPWTVSFANIDTSVAKITQVTKAGDDSFDGSEVIAAEANSVTLTDVGTYTISITLQSGGYSWAGMDAATRTISYTVVIEQAELVGTEFTFGGGWTYGEEANLPAKIKLVSRVDEDTTVSFAPPAGATIKVTFTGSPNGGAQQTYSYTYTQGSQPSPGTNVPSLAGSYTVYVEVTGMANYADVTLESCSAIEGSKFQQTEFTIARKAVALPELQDENDKQENEELGVIDYPYTGREITVDYTSETDTAISGGSYAASGTTKSTAAGDYTVTFALADKNNTRWASETLPTTPAEDDTADKTLTWYIVKADNEITGVSALGWTYGEAVIKPQITGSTFAENTHDLGDWSAAAITYRYNGAAFDEQADTLGWNVGEYTYTITYAGNANINEATYTGTFTVAKGQAVIAGTPTIDGWTYGGTANTPSGVTGVTVSGTAITPRPGYYAYYGKTNGGAAYGSEDDLQTEAPEAAGTYHVVYVVKETDNYKGATAAEAEFTISRKQIAKPAYESAAGVSGNAYTSTYNAAQQSIDITGVDAILSIGGTDGSIASRTDTAVTLSAKNVKVSGGNAAAYEVTFSFTDKNNYCWSGTADDVADVAFTWTIKKAENPITASSDTYAGWSYGSTPTDVSALQAKAKYDNLTIEHAYYAADDFDETSGKPNSGAAEIEISATTPAGSYVLYLYHEGNDNTFAADQYFAFTVSQATATISAAFADGDTLAWTYRDADSAHVLEVTVTVGDTAWQYWYRGETLQSKTEGSPEAIVVQYLGEGGSDVTADVISDGMYQLPVGNYSVKVTLDTSAVGVSGNFTASEQTVTGISVSPFVVDIPLQEGGGTDPRTFTYQEKDGQGVVQKPTEDTIASSMQSELRGAAYSVTYTDENSANRGNYTLVLQFTGESASNFQWNEETIRTYGNPAAGGLTDEISDTSVTIWYRIASAQFTGLNFSMEGWTYGEEAKDPSYDAIPSDVNSNQIEYTYYEGSSTSGTQLSGKPKDAGTYCVQIHVPESENYDEIYDAAVFIISPAQLTVSEGGWTSTADLVYIGSSQEIVIEQLNGIADNDEYGYNDTLASLNISYQYAGANYSSAAAPSDAGSYTVTATIDNDNYYFGELNAPKKSVSLQYTIAQAELTIKAVDVPDVVYGTDAEEVKAKFTVTYDGLVEADRNGSDGNYTPKDGVLSGTLDYDCSYTAASEVDTYDITPRGVSAKNYKITFEKATLTVKAAGLRGVKIDNLTGENALTYQGAAYDIETVTGATATAVNPAQNVVTWYFSESEIASQPTNETQGIITSLTNVKREADHSVGTYTIYYYVSAPNHVAQRGSVQITIDPAALTLTAKDASVVYGEDFTADTSINSYTVQIDGSAEDTLLGSDTKESVFGSFVPSYQAYVVEGDTYNAGDGVTESGYIAFDCSTPQLDNYTVTLQSGSFTVSPRAITVEIGDLQQTYGDSATAFVYSVTLTSAGATGNAIFSQDSEAGVFTLAVYQVGAEGGAGSSFVPDNKTDVGVYYIVGSSSNLNYDVAFSGSLSYNAGANNAGKYEIVARVLGNLDWTDPKSLVYDGKQKAFTATGKYGEGENAEEVSFTITYQRQTGEGAYGEETSDAPVNVGSYRVIARSNDPNFTQGLESTRTFAITPYMVTIDWNEEITLVYNGEEQIGKVSATYQPVAGDAIALAVTPDAEMKDAAEYTLTASFAEDDNALGNYALPGVVTQKYTISPRPIVVTIEDQTSEYGDDLQTLTATETLGTVTGWKDDGKGAIVPGDSKPYRLYIDGHTAGEKLAVKSYNIFGSAEAEEGGAIDGNYAVTFTDAGQANHGVYTVTPRAVTISFAEDTYTATYGTQFDFDAVADQVQFTRGTGGASGSAFADGESFASVLGETQFAVIADGYEYDEAAGSTFTMQMTLGSTTEGPLSVGNYTFTFTDAAELTVQQRAITVTIADKTDIVYGTDAVANTQLTATVALASGTGEAIVNGDTEVYSLAVYDADKNKVTRGSATPAGEYFIVGKAENNNYAITFVGSQNYEGTGDAGLFEIIISADGIRVEITNDGATVTYTGSPYYLLDEEKGTYGTLGDLANTLELGADAVNADWTDGNPFRWEFRLNDEDGDAITSLTDVKDDAGSAYTVWYKVYLPSVTSYAAKTGTFTVTIAKAENDWTQHYGHGGWAYKGTESGGNINLAFDGLETGSRFTPAAAEFGTVSYTYYGSRSGSGTEDDPYVYGDEKAKDFFNNDTPAGTYYVKVEVAGTKNYTALTDHHQLVVSKHVLTVGWEKRNVSLGTTQNTLTGYDTALMSLNDYSSELTLGAESSQDKTLQVTFADTISGTFYVTLALSDSANYAWMNPLSSNEELCRVSFSVALANNEVTISANGWTYGDVVTVALPGESAGAADRIVITATHVPGDDNSNVQIAYAYDDGAATEDTANGLSYVMGMLPTQAGTYWVRVLVTGDDTYAMGEAYAKFTIAKFQVAVPEAGAESSFTYDGGVKTYKGEIDASYSWADETTCAAALVKLANGSTETVFTVTGNRAINAGSYTAAYVLADADNYEWASSWNEEFSWVIAKAQLARPTIGSGGTDFIQTEYDPDVTKQLLAGFDPVTMSFEGATVGAAYYPEGRSSYLYAENAGTYEITLGIKDPDNYEWKDGPDTAKTVLTWTIAKAEFDIHNYIDDIQFAVGEYVYNGQEQYPRLEDAGNLPSGVRLVGYEVTAGNGTDAGEHTVTATFALTGSHADNYTFAAGGNALTQEYTIAKAVISDVTWTVQRHYTYNGEDQFDVVKAYYGLGGSIHELQVGVQEFKNYQEGGYTFTVEGFKAGDENAKNYTLSGTFSETFYIDKLSVYIVVGEAAGSHIYDGLRPTLTEYGFGKVAVYDIDGDDLRDDFIEKYDQADWEDNMRFALLDADGNTPRAWNVGSYIVTVTGAEDLQNYDVTRIQTGTLEIVPKEITITGFDSPGAAFGDDTFGPAAVTAVSGLVAGETIDVLNFLYTYSGTADDGWTADGTLTNEMHAGSYTVTVSLQGGNYVLTGNVSYSYKVSPMLVDPDLVEIDDLPYTGQAQTLTKEDTRFTGTGSAYDLFDYSVAAESGTEVGGYRVTLIIGNVNYLWQSSAAGYGNMTTDRTWRIVAAQAEDISVSLPQVSITHWGETAASVTAGGSVAAIGGTEISFNISYLFEVKDESGSWVKFTGSVWNAGDYRVRAEAASDNFPAAYSEYHEFTVQPGVYDVSGLAFADKTLTYDGQAHGLVLTVNGSAAAGGSIGGGALGATGTVAYVLSAAEADAGTYTMTATLTAGANYTFAGGETTYELTGTLVIEPYTVTIRWAEDDFTYDKQDHSGDVWAYFIGAGNSHIDLALEGADEMVDAGEYTFTVTGASDQSGAAVDLANYMLAGGDVAGAQKEYTVRKFAATVNWGQTSFTYNGEDQSASVQPSFIGVGGEEIALSVSPQALRDFGTYTFAVVIGEELKNYELSNTTAQISIAKLPVTVTADDISAALGAAEQNLTYTLAPSEAAGVFAADEAAGRVEVSLSRVPGTAAGAYDIYISVTGEGAENYALTLVGGTYTIRERAIELSITLPADLVYSGAPKAAVLIAKEVGGGEIAVPAGITLWYEGKDNAGVAYASAQAPVNAGSYTVGVRIDTQDYDVSNANITVEMIIGRAEAFIDVSGVQTQYTYTGALQRVDSGAVLSHGESALVYSNNTFTSVSEGDGKVVSVDAAMSCNYKAAHAEVTITVAKAAISPAVTIRGWTYGQSANGYTVTGNPGGGAIEAVYGGTTNAGAPYSGGQAPTEAGSYTLTVTVAETENYLSGSASTSFTVARAALHVSVSIEGWAFGESPNGYTVSPASMRGNISSVRYEGEGYSGSQPPTQVGSYTLTVTFAQTANYQGGSASDSFSITQGTLAPDSVRLTIEGWTYGEAPNSPVLTGAPAGAEVSYRYSGTANDGTAWNSDTAPSKAGSYKVTAHISAAGYASFEAEASFTVARRLVAAPTLGDTGGRTASSVYDGEEVRTAVTGYDGALMDFTAEEGTQLVMEGQQLLLAADAEGTYVLQVSLKDIYNYGWADLIEGEQIAGDIALAWEVTLAMHSLLWLIILLFILLLILIVLLVVFAKKDHDARARIAAAQQGAESGADGAADERRNHALAPAGLLFAVPVWQISLIAALAVAAAVLLVADVVLLVLWRKDAAKAERAEEAVQAATAAAQDENLQAENAQEAGGDENSASAE